MTDSPGGKDGLTYSEEEMAGWFNPDGSRTPALEAALTRLVWQSQDVVFHGIGTHAPWDRGPGAIHDPDKILIGGRCGHTY